MLVSTAAMRSGCPSEMPLQKTMTMRIFTWKWAKSTMLYVVSVQMLIVELSLSHTHHLCKQTQIDTQTQTHTHAHMHSHTHTQTHNTQDVDKANILTPYEVDRSAINIVADLGQGQFGQVSKAKMKNILPGKSESFVAVKMLKRMCFKRSNHYM